MEHPVAAFNLAAALLALIVSLKTWDDSPGAGFFLAIMAAANVFFGLVLL